MSISKHDLVRALVIGVPALLMGLWGWSMRRRAKENTEISPIVRGRKL
jgi:hypothetical protein